MVKYHTFKAQGSMYHFVTAFDGKALYLVCNDTIPVLKRYMSWSEEPKRLTSWLSMEKVGPPPFWVYPGFTAAMGLGCKSNIISCQCQDGSHLKYKLKCSNLICNFVWTSHALSP